MLGSLIGWVRRPLMTMKGSGLLAQGFGVDAGARRAGGLRQLRPLVAVT